MEYLSTFTLIFVVFGALFGSQHIAEARAQTFPLSSRPLSSPHGGNPGTNSHPLPTAPSSPTAPNLLGSQIPLPTDMMSSPLGSPSAPTANQPAGLIPGNGLPLSGINNPLTGGFPNIPGLNNPSTNGLPNFPGLNNPSTNGLPNLPGLNNPSSGGFPNIPSLSNPTSGGFPNIPGLNNPSSGGLPNIPGLSNPTSGGFPNIPGLNNPSSGGLPNIPGLSYPSTGGFPSFPGVPSIPNLNPSNQLPSVQNVIPGMSSIPTSIPSFTPSMAQPLGLIPGAGSPLSAINPSNVIPSNVPGIPSIPNAINPLPNLANLMSAIPNTLNGGNMPVVIPANSYIPNILPGTINFVPNASSLPGMPSPPPVSIGPINPPSVYASNFPILSPFLGPPTPVVPAIAPVAAPQTGNVLTAISSDPNLNLHPRKTDNTAAGTTQQPPKREIFSLSLNEPTMTYGMSMGFQLG